MRSRGNQGRAGSSDWRGLAAPCRHHRRRPSGSSLLASGSRFQFELPLSLLDLPAQLATISESERPGREIGS
jgi:hypothetical protein